MIIFPGNDAEWRRVIEAAIAQHHTDLQRLWGRVAIPSMLTPGVAPSTPVHATSSGGGGGGGGATIYQGTVDSTIAAGSSVPQSGTISITSSTWVDSGTNQTAYNIESYPLPTGTRVLFREMPVDSGTYVIFWDNVKGKFLGKTSGGSGITKGTAGSVALYKDSSTSLSIVVSANNQFATVAHDKWVWVEWNGFAWYLTAAEY